MIGKIMKGKGFGGALNYVLGKDDADLLDSNCAGRDPAAIAAEMKSVAIQNSRAGKPVLHVSLSQPTGQEHRLSDDQWRSVAGDYMKKMNLQDRQFVLVRHNDAGHDHVHLVVNRVGTQDYRVASDANDRRRSMAALREIEREHGLGFHSDSEKGRRAALRTDIYQASRASGGSFDKFTADLKKRGISVSLSHDKDMKITGISYQREGDAPVKGSALGKGYGWAGLEDRLRKSGELAAARQAREGAAGMKQIIQGRKKQAAAKGASRAKGGAGAGQEISQKTQATIMKIIPAARRVLQM